jgi:hypothetical protein
MKATIAFAAAVLLALGACTEKPQQVGQKKESDPAWKGAQDAYTAPGWKPGDQASWEQQIRNRNRGQNEYDRIGGKS